ncbi:hypothetical protein [Kingella oralis]|uniref:hypothetical protein n=1 Tax=Kingella oralis TaxID=505 RepID=UPI0034E4525F
MKQADKLSAVSWLTSLRQPENYLASLVLASQLRFATQAASAISPVNQTQSR